MKKRCLSFAAMLATTALFAQSHVATSGQKYVLLEEFTGCWCGYCPDGDLKLENVLDSTTHVIGVSIHSADGMEIPDGATIILNCITGFPTGLIDRTPGGPNNGLEIDRHDWQAEMPGRLAVAPDFDITMDHGYNVTTRELTVTVTAKALKDLTGDYNFNVYMLQDSVTGPDNNQWSQNNYYNNDPSSPFYGAGGSIDGFVHRHVVQAMLGSTWGTTGVITTNPGNNSTFSQTYTYTIPAGDDYTNHRLVGMVMKNNPTDSSARPIMNAVQAKVTPGTLGIADVSTVLGGVTLFPNPATNSTAVQVLLDKPATLAIRITDVAGRKVYHTAATAVAGEQHITIPTVGFANGLYSVQVTTGSSVATRLLHVQH